MAFNKAPSNWIPSWSENGTDISVPIASFPEMTAAEADGTTGDIRKVVFAIMEELFGKWNSLATADRPTKMVISKAISSSPTTGITQNTFTVKFYTEIISQEVEDEPV